MSLKQFRKALYASAAILALGVLYAEPKAEHEFTAADRSYWAFQPVADSAPPAADEANPIDAFLTEKLAKKGLSIGPRADKISLLRRAYFDLIGIPPSPEQVAAFVADKSPQAFENVIDELLASPHYGERWARHWLDLARYAESNGFKSDETRPYAWRYRDYVIQAFNDDKPYDRFVAEQIAGDELWPNDPSARVATAFNRHYPDESNAANLMQRRAEQLQDVTDAVGATFMGLTFGCAKCHDHKFDPILQKDYYRLQAFFANTAEDDDLLMLQGDDLADYKAKLANWKQKTADIRAEMESLVAKVRDDRESHLMAKRTDLTQAARQKPESERTPYERQMIQKHLWQMTYEEKTLSKGLKGAEKERYLELEKQLAAFDDLYPGEPPYGLAVKDLGDQAPPTYVLRLANYAAPQDEVQPGFLTLLAPGPAPVSKPAGLDSTGRRTALAKWLISEDNPLTARVMVNRIWHYHFGRGIVATPSDFGRMGERPSHPELLDWLTKQFVENGWSVKRMHRLIMTSRAYQQSSEYNEQANAKDPFDKLLWRYQPQRLESESLRDSMLAVSGLLNDEVGGPSMMPPLPDGMPKPRGGWQATADLGEQHRRSIYIFVRRNARFPMMEAFDMPDTHETCARRNVTTTAPQALALLNDEQTVEWAQGFAGRVLHDAGLDRSRQVDEAFELAYSRHPDSWEKDAALTFFDSQAKLISEREAEGGKIALPKEMAEGLSEAEGAALVDFCHTLLNSNEFVYRN